MEHPDTIRCMRKLIEQIMKFGIVGFLAFCLDYGLFLLLANIFGVHYLVSSATSFIISTVFNFVCSMRFVFAGMSTVTSFSYAAFRSL